jgi:hypothetical protein
MFTSRDRADRPGVGLNRKKTKCSVAFEDSIASVRPKVSPHMRSTTLILRKRGELKKLDVETVEIDNLYRAGIEGEKLHDFIESEFLPLWEKNESPRLLLKNLSLKEWGYIAQIIQKAPTARGAFADFAIVEKESDEAEKCGDASWKLGIRLLLSTNTHQYRAYGCYAEGNP